MALQTDREGPGATASLSGSRPRTLGRVFAGGTAGNERLTALIAVVLLILLAALGVTILRIGQLLNPHMFIGMLLIGPVLAKMGSTGYRFVRYYTNEPRYRAKGPPAPAMRLMAPIVVISTVTVFASGVALLFIGPNSRGLLSALHKGSFIVWIAVTGLHVLGHLAELPAVLLRSGRSEERPWDDHGSGRGARALLLAGSLIGGLVLALLVQSQFGAWAGYHHGG